LINIGERAQHIAEAFENRQKTTQEALEELKRLLAELKEAEKQRDETQLSPEAFAVYWLLQKQGVKDARKVADSAGKAFEQNPHWQTSGHQEQEVRKSLYKAFIDAGVKEAVVEIAQNIMRMLRGSKR
jgi:type I restriction enzyme R subunit